MASDIYQTGYNNVTNAANSGTNAINSFDPNAEANKTQAGYDSLFNNQKNTQDNYIQSYKDAIYANPKVTDLYNTGNAMFNVPTLQQNATTLNNAVLQTPQQNVDRAKGFNFDQGQVDHQTAQDLARLSPAATAATNSANTASGLAANYVQAGVAQNNTNLLPTQQEGSMLGDYFARQATGYTTASQQRFDGLKSKMESGVALSTAEMGEYSKLAQAEQSYQSQLAQTAASTKNTLISNQYQTLSPSQGVFDARTGRITPYTGTANANPYTGVGY